MKSMRYLLAVIFISALAINMPAQKIKFEKTTHDYGTIKEEAGKVECKFKFKNAGDKDLKLTNVNPTCGCTASNWTKEKIAPGEEGFVSATYNAKGRPGKFRKAITVTTNDPDNPNTTLFIKGKVKPREKTKADLYPQKIGHLRFKTNHMAFRKIKKHEVVTDSIGIYNQWKKPMNISFSRVPDHIKIKTEPQELQPKKTGHIIVTYDANKNDEYGLVFNRIYIMSNDSQKPRKLFNVSARLMEDFSDMTEEEMEKAPVADYSKTKHEFGKVNSGETVKHNFRIKNEGINDLKIRKVKAVCGCTATKPGKKTLEQGESTNIKVSFNTRGYNGKKHKTVTVITNDPKNTRQILHIQANVQ